MSLNLPISSAVTLYQAQGLQLIPIKTKSKYPASDLLPLNKETQKPTWKIPLSPDIIKGIYRKNQNLNISCMNGKRIIQIDFDSEDVFKRFDGISFKDKTLTYSTGRGYKVLVLNDRDNDFTQIDLRPYLEMELIALNHYSILPPSIHPNGKQYTVLGTMQISEMKDAKTQLLNRAINLGYIIPSKSKGSGIITHITPRKPLTESEKLDIVNSMVPYWNYGYRYKLCLYLVGYLFKQGVLEIDVKDIIKKIVIITKDDEKNARINQVFSTFSTAKINNVKGYAGLQEIIQAQKTSKIMKMSNMSRVIHTLSQTQNNIIYNEVNNKEKKVGDKVRKTLDMLDIKKGGKN